jgi:hypothetical protein
VAEFAVELHDVNVMIQISAPSAPARKKPSGILRLKKKLPRFYTLVSRDTVEQEFALNCQLFMAGNCNASFSMEATLCLIVTPSLPIQIPWKITSSIIAKDVISRFVSLRILGECSCAVRTVGMNSIPISNSVLKSVKVGMIKNLPGESPLKGLHLPLRS